jgi:hypothetical protein
VRDGSCYMMHIIGVDASSPIAHTVGRTFGHVPVGTRDEDHFSNPAPCAPHVLEKRY